MENSLDWYRGFEKAIRDIERGAIPAGILRDTDWHKGYMDGQHRVKDLMEDAYYKGMDKE